MLYETRNGAKCVPVTPVQKRQGDRTPFSRNSTYLLMQMLPTTTQRFEWIREDNLRRLDDEARI